MEVEGGSIAKKDILDIYVRIHVYMIYVYIYIYTYLYINNLNLMSYTSKFPDVPYSLF